MNVKVKQKVVTIVFFALVSVSGFSQDVDTKYKSKVKNLDQTINTFYGVISGAKGEERNWELMRYLFHPEAKLVATGRTRSGIYKAKYVTVNDYINTSGKWLVQNGFYEDEIHREVQTFGNITHVFSTYQCFKSKKDEKPFMRGINSIQLLNDGQRWWVINVYFTQESPFNSIPKRYLPKS